MKLVPVWSLTCEYYMFASQFACLFVCLLFFFLIDVIAYIVCSLCTFQLFASIKKGNSSNQNRRNCWVAKMFTIWAHIFFVKIRVFNGNFTKVIRLMRLKFWYGLLIRDFISLASSNNDSHMLMKQKCKQRLAYNFFVF